MQENILVAGGTGLVGSELLRVLSEQQNVMVTALVRAVPEPSARLSHIKYQKFNFDDPSAYEQLSAQSFSLVFLCLGTTRKKAGSPAAFVKVDFEYPKKVLDAVCHSKPRVCLVSSVGADKPAGLYLRTKWELESYLSSLALPAVVIRPSLLVGERKEFRLAERMGVCLLAPMHKFLQQSLPESWSKYAPVHARQVARAMIHFTLMKKLCDNMRIVEGSSLFTPEVLLAESHGGSV